MGIQKTVYFLISRGGAWQHARSTTVRRDHQTHSSIKWAYKKQHILLYRGVEHGNMRGVRQYDESTKRIAQYNGHTKNSIYASIAGWSSLEARWARNAKDARSDLAHQTHLLPK